MCTALALFSSDGKQGVIVIIEQSLFRFTAALCVDTFAYQQGGRNLL